MKRVPAITNPHGQPIDLLRQFRIEPEYVARRNDARYPALHQIDRSGHGAEVNTFGRRALLDIGYIALQCFSEKLHRAQPIAPRQYPRLHYTTERRAV